MTAGLAGQARKDREENRQLWRDTQRQLNELAYRVNDLTVKIAETNDKIAETNDTISRVAEESRAADQRLGERVDALVSAIGEFIRASR